MEYTELADYPVPGGEITVWVPDAAPGAWTADPRGLSFNHEVHVANSSRGSWIGGVLRIPRDLQVEALRRALHVWISRHEGLRSSIVADAEHPSPSGTGWSRMGVAADHVHIRAERIGSFSASEAGAVLEGFFAILAPTTWPHVVFATVTDDEPGFVLAFGADHSVMDAYSQLLWFAEIVELYTWALDAEADALPPANEVGSYIDFSVVDRQQGLALDEHHPIVAGWRQYLRQVEPTSADVHEAERLQGEQPSGVLHYPTYPDRRMIALHPGAQQQRSVSRWLADIDSTQAFFAAAKAAGVGSEAAVLGAFAAALHGSTAAERMQVIMPVHTRNEPQHAEAVGWFVGLCPLDVDLAGADLLTLMLRVQENAAQLRVLAAQATRAAQVLKVTPGVPFVASYVDMRHLNGAQEWKRWQARTLRSRTHSNTDFYAWILRTVDGLNVSTRYPDTPEADEAASELWVRLEHVIATAPELLSSVVDRKDSA